VEKMDRQVQRVSGLIPPEETPDEGYEPGPTTSQQLERLYQDQREVKGCLWLVVIAVVLVTIIGLYLIYKPVLDSLLPWH